MAPESMVHALEQIHSLLKPDGGLIDIRPDGTLVEFLMLADDKKHLIGYLQESDNYIEYRQAAEAVQTVLAAGLFKVEKTDSFEFFTHADAFGELKTFLEETWSDAVIMDEVIVNARKLEAEYGRREVMLREQVYIGLLSKTEKK